MSSRFAWNRRRQRKNSLLQAPRSSQRQTAKNIPSKPPQSRLPPTKPSSPSASLLAPAPGNGGPDALVEIVPDDFGRDLKRGDRARDLHPAREEPAGRESVDASP